MTKQKLVARNTYKYGMPLYGAAWPDGDVVFMAGGGGQGIQNRLVFARYRRSDHELLDQIGQFNFGENCATRTLLHPRGRLLLVALSSGQLRCFHVDTKNSRLPRVSEVSGELQQRLQALPSGQDIKAMAFNAAGDLLGLGYEGGEVKVLHWPAFTPAQLQLSGETALKGDVRDLDFGLGPNRDLLAVCSQSGECEVWQVSPPACVARLKAPSGVPGGRLERCRFARDTASPAHLYTLANSPSGTHLVGWAGGALDPASGKGPPAARRVAAVSKQKGIAMEMSPDGGLLAVATNEGDIQALSTGTLRTVKLARKAHMVFPTGVAFSRDSQLLLSISMDASAHVLDLRPTPPPTPWFTLFSVLVLLLALLVGVVLQLLRDDRKQLRELLESPWLAPYIRSLPVQLPEGYLDAFRGYVAPARDSAHISS